MRIIFEIQGQSLLEIFTDILLITKVQKIAVPLKYAYHNFD